MRSLIILLFQTVGRERELHRLLPSPHPAPHQRAEERRKKKKKKDFIKDSSSISFHLRLQTVQMHPGAEVVAVEGRGEDFGAANSAKKDANIDKKNQCQCGATHR